MTDNKLKQKARESWWNNGSVSGAFTSSKIYSEGYITGAKENGIVWHKTGTPRENVLTIIEVENCGYLLCKYRNGFWYDNNSGAICTEFITNNILRWAEIPTV